MTSFALPLDFPQAPVGEPTWQCVLVCWGDKYGAAIINNLVRSIAAHSTRKARFVLITDRDRSEVLADVQQVRFPEYWVQPRLKSSGCHAKLVMFEQGILPEDLPAIYVDLDTIVLGDMSRGLDLMDSDDTVAILQSAIIPFGPVGRALHRWTDGRRYARGNSSFVVFHPARQHLIASRFRELFARHPDFGFSPLIADERFISWVAQSHMKAIPSTFAVKFPGEFMFPWRPWLYIKALLPWVRRRRAGLVAVTLNGLLIKPERLLELPEGGVVVDEKSRQLVWSERTLGPMKQRILSYYRSMA